MKKIHYLLLAAAALAGAFVAYLAIDGFSIFRDPYRVVFAEHHAVPSAAMDEPLPVAALQADLDFLRRTIEEVGVDPYRTTPREVFDRDFARVRGALDRPLTRTEFYRQVVPLVHSLGDTHTSVFSNDIFEHYERRGGGFFPLTVALPGGDRIVVDRDCAGLGVPAGTAIRAINGIPAATIVEKTLAFEKGLTRAPRLSRAQENFHWHLWEAFGFTGPFTITFDERTVSAPAIPRAQLMRAQPAPAPTTAPVAYRQLAPGLGLLKVDSFMLEPGEFSQRLHESFAAIQRDAITDLILDVRANDGGSEFNALLLLEHLTDRPFRLSSQFLRKKSHAWVSFYWKTYKWWIRPIASFALITTVNEEARTLFGSFRTAPFGTVDTVVLPPVTPTPNPLRFTGRTCVLMGPRNFSAAVGFLAALKDDHLATLVGEETGESPSGAGELYPFDLPHSRLFAHASTSFMVRPSGDPDITHGVLPDHEVRQTAEDSARQVDTALEFTRQLLARK